jgi:hypothetical protein
MSAQSQVRVVSLHVPLTHGGSQIGMLQSEPLKLLVVFTVTSECGSITYSIDTNWAANGCTAIGAFKVICTVTGKCILAAFSIDAWWIANGSTAVRAFEVVKLLHSHK